MDEKIEKIAKIIQAERGWKADEIEIEEEEFLKRGSCSFYTAVSNRRMLSFLPNYAVISGDTVIGISDKEAVSKILNACGSDAPADWWAEIVNRYLQELGNGLVLKSDKEHTDAIAIINAAKKEFAPPKFSEEAGAKTVTYFLLEGEAYIVYFVQATRAKDHTVTVKKTIVNKSS